MINFLIELISSIFPLMMYFSLCIPESYQEKMRKIGRGITLGWQNDETGEISNREFVLRDMSYRQLRSLEKDCHAAGLKNEAEKIHEYRDFKVRQKLSIRRDRNRIRTQIRESMTSLGPDMDLSLKQIDEIAAKLGMKPGIMDPLLRD